MCNQVEPPSCARPHAGTRHPTCPSSFCRVACTSSARSGSCLSRGSSRLLPATPAPGQREKRLLLECCGGSCQCTLKCSIQSAPFVEFEACRRAAQARMQGQGGRSPAPRVAATAPVTMRGSAGSMSPLAASPAVSTTAAGSAQLGRPVVVPAGARSTAVSVRVVWLDTDSASPAQQKGGAGRGEGAAAGKQAGRQKTSALRALHSRRHRHQRHSLPPQESKPSSRAEMRHAQAGQCCRRLGAPGLVPCGAVPSSRRCASGELRCCGAHTTVTRSPTLAGTSAVGVPVLRAGGRRPVSTSIVDGTAGREGRPGLVCRRCKPRSTGVAASASHTKCRDACP